MADPMRANEGRRPRDELGRPLPRHEPNRLPLEDFDRLSTEENSRLAGTYFATGRYFSAHEAWETCWKQVRGMPDAEGFKGLAQLAAGYVHLQRGNPHGCVVLLRRAIARLRPHDMAWHDLGVPRLVSAAEELLAALESPEAGNSC